MSAVGGRVIHDERSPRHLAASWLQAARPRQWLKNGLVAAAPVAALRVGPAALGRLLIAVLAMTVAAAGNYFLNDALDATADRNHPTKRHRPVASGRIPPTSSALAGLAAILTATVSSGLLLGTTCAVLVGGYGALAAFYSVLLKRIAYLDIAVIGAGFVLRVALGGVATSTPTSAWFLAAVATAAVMVAAGKRRSEAVVLGLDAPTHRLTLARYRGPVTATLLLLAAASLVVLLTGWTLHDPTVGSEDGWAWIVVAPAVLGIGRYLRLAWVGGAAEPEALATDPMLVVAAVALVGLYLAGPVLT